MAATAEAVTIGVLDVARIFGVHPNSVYKMVKAGALQPIETGLGKYLFSRDAVMRLVNSEAIR